MSNEEFIEKYNIKGKLVMAEEELHEIELTADKTRRQRWRLLKELIEYYKRVLRK